jgi:uncharacterized protein (TIGR02246 family)
MTQSPDAVPAVAAQQPNKSAPGAPPDRSGDDAAIRATVEAFTRAYNAGDAKAIAALFTPEGAIIDKEGNETEGRDAIEQVFKEILAETPKKQMEITIESIRFVGPDMAVEVGTTKEIHGTGEPPTYDRYTALHVKRDGKWLMALARDEEGPPPTAHERLKPLAWLVGEWVDDGGSAVVASTCRWSEDGNFLLQDFKLQVHGRDEMIVSQRIGWDPLAKNIRSWNFDSEGGFGESVWTRDDNEWIIKATGVRPDGTTASATNLMKPTGTDGYIWRSTDRIVGDERQPQMEVKVVRKPPEPKK